MIELLAPIRFGTCQKLTSSICIGSQISSITNGFFPICLLGNRWFGLCTEILSRKVVALNTLERSTTLITAPSQWLTDEASRSSILGRFDTQTIPNCLDTDLYKPYDKQAAKQVFGLPENVPAVLFVAGKLGAPRKGLDLLYEAYKSLPENKCVLAAIGEGDQVPAGTKSLGMINDQRSWVAYRTFSTMV